MIICPNCGRHVGERRQATWHVRTRLYDATAPDDPKADSDPELPPGEAGADTLRGLAAVGGYLRELTEGFHGDGVEGFDDDTMARKVRGVRPTISRHGGFGTIRVPYVVHGQPWIARVDIRRDDT